MRIPSKEEADKLLELGQISQNQHNSMAAARSRQESSQVASPTEPIIPAQPTTSSSSISDLRQQDDTGVNTQVIQPDPEPVAAPVQPQFAPQQQSGYQWAQTAPTSQTQTSFTSSTSKLGPDGKIALGQFNKSIDDQKLAENNLVDAQIADEGRKRLEIEKELKKQEDERTKLQNNERLRQEQLQGEFNKYNAAVEDVSKFEFKNYFENTGQKIVAAIAVGLGAAGASLGGGSNGALTLLQTAMASDLELQKRQYEKLKDKAEGRKSVYGMLRERLGEVRQADLAWMNGAIEVSKQRVSQIEKSTSDATIKAKARVLIAGLDTRKAEVAITAADRIQTGVTQQVTPNAPSNVLVGPDGKAVPEVYKTGADLVKAANEDPLIKEANKARISAKKMKDFEKNGLGGAIDIMFIADFLMQGSTNAEQGAIVKDYGLSQIVGTEGVTGVAGRIESLARSPEFRKRVVAAVNADAQRKVGEAQPRIELYHEQARRFGMKPEQVVPMPSLDAEEKDARAGGRKISK